MFMVDEDRKFRIWRSISRTYASWASMRSRCLNSKSLRYKDYGDREITVCKRWRVFKTFLLDMGEKPDGLSLERKDNDKGYCLDNCKWATPTEQMNNTRRNRLFIAYGPDGQEELAKNQSAFARKFGLTRAHINGCLNGRLKASQGWSFAYIPEDFPRYNEILKLFEVKE
jgi:hypothetical protein